MRTVLAICALLLVSCSRDQSYFQAQRKSSDDGSMKPVNIQVIGKVKVDEFRHLGEPSDVRM